MTALVGWLALVCLAVVAPASTLLVWTDTRAPVTFGGKAAAVWRSVGQTLRLGGEVGPPLRIVLSLLLALVALLYVSTLVGIITTALTDRLTELQRGHSTVVEHGHTVVLGWSEQAPTVVAEVVAAHAQRRAGAVAVLAERDITEMDAELRAGLAAGSRRTRLLCRGGRPADPVALARVAPATAGAVVVLPPDGPDSGAQVVKALLALRAALDEDDGADGGAVRVVAAVRGHHHRAAAALAAGPDATVLDVDDIAARLLVQCVHQPGLSLVLEDLLDFAGAELHTLHEPGLAGRRFGSLRAGCAEACAVGIVRAGGALVLNPPPETELGPGDGLVVVAEDGRARALGGAVPVVDATVITAGPRPRTLHPGRVVMLGWNRRAARVVELLVRGGVPGSTVDVIAAEAPGGGVPVLFHRADPLTEAALRQVDGRYDHVVVLGPDRAPDLDEPDDRTLVTLLHLRAHEARTGRALPLVAELADARNRPIAPVGPGADVVVSGRLVGLLMAQISQNGHLAAAFEELFGAGGASVRLRPSGDFVLSGAETTFATVVAAAGRYGACAIGYRSAAGVRLNPPKRAVRCWGDGDEVVVVEAEPAAPQPR
ncbi:NAD-binding lipoprotein [Streptomyces sp. NPDC004267]|uniref:CASTOR/POLLUX-related putative ion channel n=1 Tax=Streptomyces sp. NPDC004267 TaxID=3364694 RepID=UPI003692D9AB